MNFLSSYNEKDKAYKKLSYILMLGFFIITVDSLIIGTNSAYWAKQAVKYYPFILCVFLIFTFLASAKGTFSLNYLYILVIPICMLINFIVAPGYNSFNNYMHIVVLVIDAMFICMLVPFDKFFPLFEKVMYFLAIYSLVIYVLSLVAPSIIERLPVIINLANAKYYSAGLTTVWDFGLRNTLWLRNGGLFREPGVYQMYLNLALCYYLFKSKQIKVIKILVYSVTIITTSSTTGILSLVVLFLAYIAHKKEGNKRTRTIAAVVLSGIFIIMLSSVSDQLVHSLNKLSDSSNPSTAARFGSIVANLDMWIRYPLFGIGAAENISQFPRLVLKYTEIFVVDNTNTFLFLLSSFGVVVGAIILIGTFKLSKYIGESSLTAILLFVFFIMLFSGENLTYSILPYILVAYGYISLSNKQVYNENIIN